jgi:hypothetical protein
MPADLYAWAFQQAEADNRKLADWIRLLLKKERAKHER